MEVHISLNQKNERMRYPGRPNCGVKAKGMIEQAVIQGGLMLRTQ